MRMPGILRHSDFMGDSVLHSIVRYTATRIPDFFHREDWVAALLFLLFIFMVISHNNSRNILVLGITDLTKHPQKKDITMRITFGESLSRIILLLTSNSVISLVIYTSLTLKSSIEFNEYLTTWIITLGFIMLKYLSMRLVGYIFLGPEITRIGISTYYSILIVTGLLFYPLVVLKIYLANGEYASTFDTIILIISILTITTTTIKIFQIFYHKILDIFYILLYLCTLEILPIAVMFLVYNLFIRDFNF